MWTLLIIFAAVVALALLIDGVSATVKQREEPAPCAQCGKPTWSISGVCVKCRGTPAMTPVLSTEIQPPPNFYPAIASSAPREAATDAEGRIAEDIGCSACGYNLRGLVPTSACPECSLPIGLSIKGDLLQFSNPNWVNRLVNGVRIIIAGIFASIGFSIVFMGVAVTLTMQGGFPLAVQIIAGLIGAAVSMVFVFGVWLLTTPDPSQPLGDGMLSARQITRWGIMMSLLNWPVQLGLMSQMGTGAPNMAANPLTAPTPALMGMMVASTLVNLVVMIAHLAGLVLLRKLARRIPRQSLARQTSIVLWGYGISLTISVPCSMAVQWMASSIMAANPSGGIIAVWMIALAGNCLGALGLLVFGVWTLVLLFLYAGSFKRCAAAAKDLWAQSMQSTAPTQAFSPV